MADPRDDVMLRDALEARTLSGHSGAQVFLMTKDSRFWFVRKAAKTAEASTRLRHQASKQSAFAREMADEPISTPRILDEGEIDGRFFYDMEFVRGPDGSTFLMRASYDEVARFADRLCAYLRIAATRPALADSGCKFFDALYARICEVQRTTGTISPENLSHLFLALDRLRQLGDVPPTLCHGDLTLQNMVIGTGGTIWMLDLLDAPFEHYWQDIAKLHQDVAGGWYLLEQQAVAQCVLDFVSHRLLAAASQLHEGYSELHALFVASIFVRILPYARTERETQFITERIDYFSRQSAAPARIGSCLGDSV